VFRAVPRLWFVPPVPAANQAHPWLRIHRVLRVLNDGRRTSEAFRKLESAIRQALAVRDQVRRAGWFN